MSLDSAADKYDFQGIGKASATVTIAALAANPSTLWLTTGFVGSMFYWLLTQFYSKLASVGLVILNVGIADVQIITQHSEFDGSFDDAFKLINAGPLTDEQKSAIDNKVISAFKSFASFGSVSDVQPAGSPPGNSSTGVG